jgi:hypothetical protein
MHSLRRHDPGANADPLRVSQIGNWVDCVAEQIRDDGIVAVKQPDIFSQARLTRYRKDFEQEMSKDLGSFKTVLAARINRLDSATTTQTTTLGAALAPSGATNVSVPSSFPKPSDFFSTSPDATLDQRKNAFSELKAGGDNYNLGLEPTIYLDEKKRFLEHLNQIRRISIGPDQSDSAGYGLYLVRFPVSITPGEHTYQGFGADVAITVEHEFGPSFLPSTIRDLVVNDVVSQVGPVIYELIRSGALGPFGRSGPVADLIGQRNRLEAERLALVDSLMRQLVGEVGSLNAAEPATRQAAVDRMSVNLQSTRSKPLGQFLIRSPETGRTYLFASSDPIVLRTITSRLKVVLEALAILQAHSPASRARLQGAANEIQGWIFRVESGAAPDYTHQDLSRLVDSVSRLFLGSLLELGPNGTIAIHIDRFRGLLVDLYKTALPDDVIELDTAAGVTADQEIRITSPLARTTAMLAQIDRVLNDLPRTLPSTRNPKQVYPISPREVPDFFLRENLILLAQDAARALQTDLPRATDVRNYLRQTAYVAFDTISKPVAIGSQPPVLDQALMDRILLAVLGRQFGPPATVSPLVALNNELLAVTEARNAQKNVVGSPVGALCWALAVDTVLLDAALRDDVRKVFGDHGRPCPDLAVVRFYDPTNPESNAIFQEYVRLKWPVLTFAIDPVVDQQNIADSFNLRRDLQLALAFAFASGQVNFSQANTFRRQIEQAADTIALNRTVTGYAQGDATFGFRLTPRYQNPPNQRTNLGVIASQLISGGPGPNYGLKHSKLEAGMRELTAVVIVPTFLRTIRLDVAGNWFRLNDPEHLVVPTRRMLEQGRKVQELKGALARACNAVDYRAQDLRGLQAKVQQLEDMLPMQSRVVQLPYENTATGFELFSEGVSALAPEITGFEGVDEIATGQASEIFVFGKYFSIHETHVIVGGKPLHADDKGFDVISREILQVRIPGDVQLTRMTDQQSYVEVHVATPSGISNRLLIPFRYQSSSPPPGSAAPPAPEGQLPHHPQVPALPLGGETPPAEPPAREGALPADLPRPRDPHSTSRQVSPDRSLAQARLEQASREGDPQMEVRPTALARTSVAPVPANMVIPSLDPGTTALGRALAGQPLSGDERVALARMLSLVESVGTSPLTPAGPLALPIGSQVALPPTNMVTVVPSAQPSVKKKHLFSRLGRGRTDR